MDFHIIKMSESVEITGRDFVGVSQNDCSQLQVTVPYGIEIPNIVNSFDTKNMRFLKTYVKAIQKALNEKNVRNSIESVTAGINHPVAAVNIIYDYITLGPLVEFEMNEVLTNSGKMDLNRTIQKVIPTYINDNLIYDKYITRKRVMIQDSYVASVQGNIINHFMKNGGELLFGSSIKVIVKPIKLDSTVRQKLRKELNKTFNSRKLTVIRWMLEYLEGILISNENKGKWNYAIIASTLWEVMVDAVFSNQSKRDKTKYGKRYSFTSMTSGASMPSGKATQHDTIYEDNEKIIIIDAKMYKHNNTLLTEEVLGKQFGYYHQAKKCTSKKVINILLLPTIKEFGENDGFLDTVILDPHNEPNGDPEKIIFIYKYNANQLVMDYYYGKRKYDILQGDFNNLISKSDIRKFLNDRKTSY